MYVGKNQPLYILLINFIDHLLVYYSVVLGRYGKKILYTYTIIIGTIRRYINIIIYENMHALCN